MAETVYIALGSNLGNREQNVLDAIARIQEFASDGVERSSLYLTDPQNVEDEAEEFVNAVARLTTTVPVRELLVRLQEIEVALGRPGNHSSQESRTIDLDIICYGDVVIDEPDLIVPHPRASIRLFVLMPLAELAPDLVLPGTDKTVRGLIAALLSV